MARRRWFFPETSAELRTPYLVLSTQYGVGTELRRFVDCAECSQGTVNPMPPSNRRSRSCACFSTYLFRHL
jgi:hypothetical protein